MSDQHLQLKNIDLSDNQIANIDFLKQLPEIQEVKVKSNEIESINFLGEHHQIQRLHLDDNRLTNINFLNQFSQLKILTVTYNNIKGINFLRQHSQLRNLDLGGNQIVDVSFLELIPQLQNLSLIDNQIKDVSVLAKLSRLQNLDLRKNQIKVFLGELLKSWPVLHSLYLSGNPITNIPKEHFESNQKNALVDLRGYFTSLQQGSLANDEVKLIVVGNTTAGKTSLIQFLRNSAYEHTQNSTHGIALTRWQIPYLTPTLQVNIWDFGGQEYYHATHRLFLDDHAIYVVVWEVDTNKECIIPTTIYLSDKSYQLPLEHFSYSYWLDSVRYYAPNSTILLVQNKIDETGIQNVEDDYFRPDYRVSPPAYHLSIYHTSENKDNLSNPDWAAFQAFKASLINALQTDAARYELGIGWVVIRDAVRKIAETTRWMTIAEFENFCQHAVAEIMQSIQFNAVVEMQGLLTYLSGAASTIVYYAGDNRLKNIVFLNPQWVTDTIYDILTYDIRERNDNQGEFSREQAEQVLNEKGIGELTDTFLELMKKGRFELIFEKPNCPNEYIVPQYLPETHGEKDIERYRRRTAHSFTLHFPRFMPRSIFLRFMVRYGNLATEVYWKYGIVLEKSKNDKLVTDILAECKFPERKIRIAIEGDIRGPFAQELFEGLWSLSDHKPEIEVSVNETDFVTIGDLIEYINRVPQIRSKQGNWFSCEDYFHLFGKTPKSKIPVKEIPDSKTPEIFFSYAWGDEHENGESREKIVNELYESLKNDNYQVVRDKMDLGYKGLISEFIKRIGKGSIVVVAISDKYLKSPYCMFELLEIYRHSRLTKEEFVKVVYPIRVESIALNKPGVQSNYFDYWDEREKEWGDFITKHRARVKPAQFEEYDKVRSIHNQLGDLVEHLSDMNALTKDLLSADNFAKIKEAIKARIESLKT